MTVNCNRGPPRSMARRLVADLAMFFTGESSWPTLQRLKLLVMSQLPEDQGLLSDVQWSEYLMDIASPCGYTELDMQKLRYAHTCVPSSFAGCGRFSKWRYDGERPISAKNKAGEWLENNEPDRNLRVKIGQEDWPMEWINNWKSGRKRTYERNKVKKWIVFRFGAR